jgi:hypothetical protein
MRCVGDHAGTEEWVTMVEAARRLGMCREWFRKVAKEEGLEVMRRGGRPGVNWADVERYIERARITGTNKRPRYPDSLAG